MYVELREFNKSNIDKIEEWFVTNNEWMNWDAPWEWTDYIFDKEEQLSKRLEKTSHSPCFEYEIFYNTEHVGWISAYYMTDDYKWNDLNVTNKIAIGIDIPETKYRGLGIGTQAYKLYLDYFKSLGYNEIYTQTWSGNIPMISLALSSGFQEINRFKNIRKVKDNYFDALTFKINL